MLTCAIPNNKYYYYYYGTTGFNNFETHLSQTRIKFRTTITSSNQWLGSVSCSATSTDIWSWPRQGSITSEVEITFYKVKKERTYIGWVDVKKLASK